MTYRGFEISRIQYPDAPSGWVDGVYCEREPRKTPLAADAELPLSFACRAFREREETGWGVFDYIDGVAFSFPSALSDWEVAITVSSRSDACRVSVFCDGIKAASGIEITSEPTEIKFNVRSADDISTFYLSPEYGESKEEAEEEFTVFDISRSPLPQRQPGKKPTLFLASDSTVQTYDPYYYPQTGWGEVLYRFFTDAELVREYRPEGSTYSQCRAYELPGVTIENRSIGGRSSRSFFLEGKLSELLARAARGDFLMIQFGHNDCTRARPNRYVSPDGYESYIRRYIRAALARGITPILVTPVNRRSCDENGVFSPSFPDYSERLRALSEQYKVPLIDLASESLRLLSRVGAERSKRLFLFADEGEYKGAYAKGVSDNTHLSRTGALLFAGLAAGMLRGAQDERLSQIGALVDEKRISAITEALLGKL